MTKRVHTSPGIGGSEMVMLDDNTIAQLFETLIWQATDADGEPLDHRGYDRSDIDPDQQEALIARFRAFIDANNTAVSEYMNHTGRDMSDVAHDYILNCNRHGTGFWDRCYCGKNKCYAGGALDTACVADGEVDLYLDDDGSVHIYM